MAERFSPHHTYYWTAPQPIPSVGRPYTCVIAAKDSRWADYADMVCTGVDDQEVINKAITDYGNSIYLMTGTYAPSSTFAMNKAGLALLGDGQQSGTVIDCAGLAATEAAITITKDYCTVRGLKIINGGGSGDYGIVVDGTTNNTVGGTFLDDVYVQQFKTYGVYLTGGVQDMSCFRCRFASNDTAQFYAVTDGTGQNGNDLCFTDCYFSGDAGETGLVWAAATMSCFGCNFEVGAIGVDIKPASGQSAQGFGLYNCYFEALTTACISVGVSGRASYGTILGCRFTGNSSATDLIRLVQMTGGFIGQNVYDGADVITGRAIATTTAGENLWIIFPASTNGHANAPTFGEAHVWGSDSRQIVPRGDVDQVGWAWTAGAAQSDAIIANGADTAFFTVPGLKPNDYLASVRVVPDFHANDTLTVTVAKLLANGTAWTQVATQTWTDGAATPWADGRQLTVNYRVEDDYAVRVVITLAASADAKNRVIGCPRLNLVRV